MNPVVLFDTYSVFFRAFYALPAMETTKGEATSAVYGFSTILLKTMRELRPGGLAFALDSPEPTFRHELYSHYKAQRESLEDDLLPQLGRLHELISLLQVPAFAVPGFEGDDILATLARRLSERERPTIVVSGDRDLLQVVDPLVRVLFIGARGKTPTMYDADAVVRRFEVDPGQLPAWIALVGDPSDNLPGAAGIGPRNASRLVRQFGTVSNMIAHLAEVTPDRTRESLRASAERVLLNERLIRLRSDLTLGEGPMASAIDREALERARVFFDDLEFKSLGPRLDALLLHGIS